MPWSMGPMLLLLLTASGQTNDLVSMVPPVEYFKAREVEVSLGKMVDLAATDPKTPQAQIAQLLALRWLADEAGNAKKDQNYAGYLKTLEDIAAGKKAQDRLGFAKAYATKALQSWNGAKPPPQAFSGSRDDGLTWFPAGATIVGSLDGRVAPATMPKQSTIPDLFKIIPAEAKKEIFKTIDGLGNVQLDRVSFAFVQESGQIFVRFTGKVQQEWVVEFARKLGLESKTRKGSNQESIAVADMNRQPALALIGDTELLLCGLEKNQGNHAELIEIALAIREGKKPNVLTGGLKAELKKVPAKAIGLLVGDVPEAMQQDLQRSSGASPRKILAFLERASTGLDFQLEAQFDNNGDAKAFVATVSKGRQAALDGLKNAPANLPPGMDLNAIRNLLESFQIEAKDSAAKLRALVPEDTLQALPTFMLRGAAVGFRKPPSNWYGASSHSSAAKPGCAFATRA